MPLADTSAPSFSAQRSCTPICETKRSKPATSCSSSPSPETVAGLQRHSAFILVTELGLPSFRSDKTLPAIAIVIGVVLAAAFDLCHISVAAIAGCVGLLLFEIVTIEEAYEEIEWEVVFLLAGLLPLGIALQKTGEIGIISSFLTDSLGAWGPPTVLGGLYLTTAVLTSFMSNQATAILFTPRSARLNLSRSASIRAPCGSRLCRLGELHHADRLPDQHHDLRSGSVSVQ